MGLVLFFSHIIYVFLVSRERFYFLESENYVQMKVTNLDLNIFNL